MSEYIRWYRQPLLLPVRKKLPLRKLLFDVKPKRTRKDLYDFEEELQEISKAFKGPLVIVTGLRRTGKTSLILTSLEDGELPYLFFDLREGCASRSGLYKMLSEGMTEFFSRQSKAERFERHLKTALRLIRGIAIAGAEVSFEWGEGRSTISQIFSAIDDFARRIDKKVIIVFDEIQRGRGIVGRELLDSLAHSYDFSENLVFVLSGSETELLYKMLRNERSPLFGRYYAEVRTRKLNHSESLDFLQTGFSEAKMNVKQDELEEIVNSLDGIIGWLTYAGYQRVSGVKDFDRIVEDAISLAKNELENFISMRMSRRYRTVLKSLAEEITGWSELKRRLEKEEEREVSDRALYEILQYLRAHSIIDERNLFTNPINKEAAKRL